MAKGATVKNFIAKYGKIVRAGCSCVVAAFLFLIATGVSFGWFSNNKRVSTSGMSVSVNVSANVIVSATPDFTGASSYVALSVAPQKLLPATHTGYENGNVTGLGYVDDTSTVDYESGLGEALVLTNVPVATDAPSGYYIDTTVYITSSGAELDNVDLSVEFDPKYLLAEIYHNAASIDFYLGTVSGENYKGTLNVAGLDNEINDAETRKERISLLENGSIPCINEDDENYLTIAMRCYFDGALKNTANTAFVAAQNLVTNSLTFGISFLVEEKNA